MFNGPSVKFNGVPLSEGTDASELADRLSGHMLPLDGLRGIAILVVMLFHFAGEFQRMTGTQPAWLRALRRDGSGSTCFSSSPAF